MNVSRSGIAATMLALPVLAAHAVTTAEFASKAPAAPVAAVAPSRAASAATPTRPENTQRQADDKVRAVPSAAPKPAQR